MSYNDDKLTLEELDEIKAGISKGKLEESLNKLSREELGQLKDNVTQERELSENELDVAMGGIPYESGKQISEEHPEIFRKK